MTCSVCGKLVRGRPSPSKMCKACRGVADKAAPVAAPEAAPAVVETPAQPAQ